MVLKFLTPVAFWKGLNKQTGQTQIRLLLKMQSDQGLMWQGKTAKSLKVFKDNYGNGSKISNTICMLSEKV